MEHKLLLDVESTTRFSITGYLSSIFAKEAAYCFAEYAEFKECESLRKLERYLMDQSITTLPDVLLIEIDEREECFRMIEKFRKNILLKGMIIVLLSDQHNPAWEARAKKLGVHDYYEAPYAVTDIIERLTFLVKFKMIKPTLTELHKDVPHYVLPLAKRIFDIIFSSFALLLISPLLLITAICVRLESKGPIVYKSRRVGTGFKVFDFYKFRSMYVNADKKLTELTAQNEYKVENGKTVFFKIKNDPRITRVGRFIRKTSIDELPQLINILKGDMSVVGNRPLPFYEAEMLTSDDWSWRFLAPAGLTGLWQICRAKREISERERKRLDNFYAKKNSMLFDLKILAQTPFAFLQRSDD
ncbi:MAG: wcaJ 1 [Flavipsychrobacter sp.]|jgi:lipopolysaccharide/colanic/teichoic acid biosynthesis glycosyltransferase|nr:wcaJ 1 [Flavipsychrobacter sp.]